jgi:hypothetical protein
MEQEEGGSKDQDVLTSDCKVSSTDFKGAALMASGAEGYRFESSHPDYRKK